MLDESVYDVWVAAGERFDDGRIVRAEDEQGFVGRVGEGAGEEEFAAVVGLARVAEVVVAIGTAARQVIIDNFVDQREISHVLALGPTPQLYRKARIDFDRYLPHICIEET